MPTSHRCKLPIRDTCGLPKLPPNARWTHKMHRMLRKLFILNPNHFMCKYLFRNKSALTEERRRHATSPYFFVIHPLSSFSVLLEILFFLSWIYTILCGPLTVWYVTLRDVQKLVVLPIRVVLILFFFIMGYVDKKTKQIITEPKRIIRRYLKTYFFFDLMSCYILEWVSHLWLDENKSVSQEFKVSWFEIVVVVRTLACCVRIGTLLKFFDNLLANMRFNKPLRAVSTYILKTYIYVHIFAVFLFIIPYIVHSGKWPVESWLYQASLQEDYDENSAIYCESFILAAAYFFGISYKYDITLLNEQVCVVVTSFFGRLYTLYLLADVLRIFGIAGVSESMYERNAHILKQYMNVTDLPDHLKRRMVNFYEYKFQMRYFKESEIVNTLSENLRVELFLFSAKKLIEKVDIFRKLPSETVGAIVATMRSEIYSPRDIIMKLGWEKNTLFFISSGTVAVIDKLGYELCHLGDGDIFGISCLLLKERNHSVVAVETTEVFTIDKSKLLEFLKPYPDVLSKFFFLAKQRIIALIKLENQCHREKLDVLSELQKGDILERPATRMLMH